MERDYFYWELHEGGSIQAIRWEIWKAVRSAQGKPVELYDLSQDLSESKDLASEHPDLIKKAVEMMSQARTPDPQWPDPALPGEKGNKTPKQNDK